MIAMVSKFAYALVLLATAAGLAWADEPYPFAGVFSQLEAKPEADYGMTKFTCLASFTIQRSDGSYTAYHIDSATVGSGKIMFHPYESGSCSYTAVTNMEHCKVSKSNWGESEYFIQHAGQKDGAMRLNQVNFKTPNHLSEIAMRKCPFDEAHIMPFLSEEFLNYSDDDFSWTILRWLPFNPGLGPKIAKALGLAAP